MTRRKRFRRNPQLVGFLTDVSCVKRMAVVVFVALAFAACGQGAPERVVARGDSVEDSFSTTTAAHDTTTTSAAPTTTVVPPTTMAPPTTVPHFSVRDMTVTMDECRNGFPPQGNSGATYGCLGTFLMHLNPGTGGAVSWTAAWRMFGPCDNSIPAVDRTTSGTIDVPTGAAQITGKLAIFSETDTNPRMVEGHPAANVSHVVVAITSGASGQSSPTPVYGDGDCSVAGQYSSPSMGSSVAYP
jgi:hypothetical protein